MMTMTATSLDRAVAALAEAQGGTGGAVAVLRRGELLVRHAWGWADLERRLPFGPSTLFRICSISKQFTCGVLLDAVGDPALLDGEVRARLPRLGDAAPTAAQLAHNQSGLRDYWATAMLCGAPVEGAFGPAEARRLIGLTRSLQFRPGTRYSYCNQNFRLLGESVEARTGQPLADLMRRRLFDPAGMETALLCPETVAMPDGTQGYEGTVADGFRAAVNRIHWTGDAGIAASLDDLIAWERFIDRTRDDPGGIYNRLSAPVAFADGTPAAYGFGLNRMTLHGRAATGHGGALRGWRSMRVHVPGERLSVVVLINQMADARAAAVGLVEAVLGMPERPPPRALPDGWSGVYEEPETGLVVRLEPRPDRRIALHYGQRPELLEIDDRGDARADSTRLARTADGLRMERGADNLSSLLTPLSGDAPRDIEGVFRSDEYQAELTCAAAGGVLYAAASGFLGQGMMAQLLPAGPDRWRLPCPRALDSAAPGDWTLRFSRDEAGRVAGVRVGCWLARGIEYRLV